MIQGTILTLEALAMSGTQYEVSVIFCRNCFCRAPLTNYFPWNRAPLAVPHRAIAWL